MKNNLVSTKSKSLIQRLSGLSILLSSTSHAEVHFEETFDSLSAWKSSTWKSASEMQEFLLKPLDLPGTSTPSSTLATTQDARFYASSGTFPNGAFSNENKSLLLQYEVTSDHDVECGGGYLKVGPKLENGPEEFGDPSDYSIMFGPDKCGHTKRTHLIFNYKGKNVLKKVDLPYKQDGDGISTLYRMVLHSNNTVAVEINDENVYTGNLDQDWDMLPPAEIDDKDDKKPEDWVDDSMINDPTDSKPDDWVEEKEVVDSNASQPADWDTEEDGVWEQPMIKNPLYKGEWVPKRISNPDYKGVWPGPKKVKNPDYPGDAEVKELYLLNKKEFSYLGFDLWQVKGGSKFDNIVMVTGKPDGESSKDNLYEKADEYKKKCMKLRDEQTKAKAEKTEKENAEKAAAAAAEKPIENKGSDVDDLDEDDEL